MLHCFHRKGVKELVTEEETQQMSSVELLLNKVAELPDQARIGLPAQARNARIAGNLAFLKRAFRLHTNLLDDDVFLDALIEVELNSALRDELLTHLVSY